MHITTLRLDKVRIIDRCELSLSEGVTAFIGDNGQGKTTILESIFWASHHKSFRHVSNDDVIATNSDSAKIYLEITDNIRNQDIDITLNRVGRNSVFVNGQKLKRNRDLLGTLRVTIFTPDDLEIIKGSSQLRRDVIDDTLSQVSKKFVAASSDYAKILKQKNALLKEQYIDRDLLDVLNNSLSISGAQILHSRFSILEKLRNDLSSAYQTIADENNEVDLNYLSKVFGNDKDPTIEIDETLTANEIAEIFKSQIDHYCEIEMMRRHSVIGPHRDDISLLINQRQSRTQASQGEQRSLALALKMATHKVITDITSNNPILLLDDVFSELDLGRTHRLIETLPATQTFVTSAIALPNSLKVNEIFKVDAGNVKLS